MVLIDDRPTKARTGHEWYHMATDNHSEDGLDELHHMADALGLHRHWLHRRPGLPHYDVPHWVKAQALRLGALEVSTRELVTRCRRAR